MDGKLYEFLGIKPFKKIALELRLRTYYKKPKNSNYFLSGNSFDNLADFERMTRINEEIHTLGTLLGVLAIYYMDDRLSISGAIIYASTAVNFYAAMLQRYNRARIYTIMDKLKDRADASLEK